MADRWQLEDASGFWQLEDGTGYWILEEASGGSPSSGMLRMNNFLRITVPDGMGANERILL